MMAMLSDIPPMLATAWVAWFIAGGALVMWYRRAVDLEFAPVAAPRPAARAAKAAARPPSGVRTEAVAATPVEEAPVGAEAAAPLYEPPPGLAPVAAREKKPVVIGDPFGDLATLLDQAAVAASTSAPQPNRAPADSPILSSSGSPIRRANNGEPTF